MRLQLISQAIPPVSLILVVDGATGRPWTVVLRSRIVDVDDAVTALADGLAETSHVSYGGNEQTDTSVGFEPQPHLDADGKYASNHGQSYGQAICSSLTQTKCPKTAGCTWTASACKWVGTRPGYFSRSSASADMTYTTVIRHYVETQDTLDNMQGTGLVQWNKHGAIYTYGNQERFPFGVNRYSGAPQHGKLDETGSSTWGFSKYESIYGYGYYKGGVWSTAGCCSTSMGGNWGTHDHRYYGGISLWGTENGIGGTDSNAKGAEYQPQANGKCRFAVPQRGLDSFAQGRDYSSNAATQAAMEADLSGALHIHVHSHIVVKSHTKYYTMYLARWLPDLILCTICLCCTQQAAILYVLTHMCD